ncbi:MAG: S8/S53 family peptidase [Oligoflexia bacterium]|nr:S8/S53 family peptidase [Oligoflexia bacterium]
MRSKDLKRTAVEHGRQEGLRGEIPADAGRTAFTGKREEEQRARGVIVRFHRWPTLKEQKELARILKAGGLKRTKSLKSFKAQLFVWEEGGLKPSRLGDRACLEIKSLSNVRRCSPDHLLSVNSFKSSSKFTGMMKGSLKANKLRRVKEAEISSHRFIAGAKRGETESGFNFECEGCKNQGVESLSKVVQKALNVRTCDIVSHKRKLMGGQLSDYWAQELIGSDLLREELEKTSPPDVENWIAVFDSHQGDHNIAVKNLISDEGFHAVLPELGERKAPFLDTQSSPQGSFLSDRDYRKGKGYKPALSLYETSYPGDYLFGFKKRAPHYINNSMGWGESEDIYEVFKKLSSSGVSKSIVVSISHNNFPYRLEDIKSKASKDFDVILAGSFSPRGFVSKFSQSDKELSILAPSDNWITSAGKKGEYRKFGGTSGAAPLVTGSLAGFEWLSGYHPTAKEAKILLEKTAFPTLHSFEKPLINGVGLLNAYKLGEVAKRLKEKCEGKSNFCFKEEILKDESYRFSEDKSLSGELKRVFPSCAVGGEKLEALSGLSDCEEKREVFKRLRKAMLLRPSQELLKSLSCIYKEGGFGQNAEVLDKLAMSLGTEEEVRAKLKARLAKEGSVSDDILRLSLGMGGFEEEFNLSELERGINIAEGLGEKGLSLLEKGFASGDWELQEQALYSAGRIGEKGLSLLEKGFASDDQELQEQALLSAGNTREKGLSLLEKGFASDDQGLQKAALFSASNIGEKALPLLRKMLKNQNLDENIKERIENTIADLE